MGIALAFLATICATVNTPETDHAKYTRLHKEWLRLHEADERTAQLIIDPRQSAMWIESRGEVHKEYVVDLPEGFRWYAFHVSHDGITERSFPLRLTRPRPDIEDEAKEEHLWVIALTDEEGFRLSFSATRSGIAFHTGLGSRTGDVTIHLPARQSKPTEYKSFVAPQSPRMTEPKDLIQMEEFAVRVERRTAAPNAR